MEPTSPHCVLVVDKPRGYSSHDVVRSVRRALRTRAVGHAGTLDPMATGVLVVGVGEGTKLLHHLSGDDKTYVATVKLGAETDTLDAEGKVVRTLPVPADLDSAKVSDVAQRFVGELEQLAPAVSAIKRDGVALYERVRRGEEVTPPMRSVVVHALEVLSVQADEIALRVHCGKGFYVRALARDLAQALGTLGHLTALRRIQSGAFSVDEAVAFDVIEAASAGQASSVTALRGQALALADALRGVPRVVVNAQGFQDVRNGKPFDETRLVHAELPPPDSALVAVLDESGRLTALGRRRAAHIEIVRGILLP